MQLRSLAGPFVAVVAILACHPGYAQDNSDLLKLLPGDPNGFVRAVQQKLADADLYKGRIHGSLTKATIAAISAACRQADVAADCGLGPLTTKGSVAVIAALDQLEARKQPAETPTPAAETPVAEPAESAPTPPPADQPDATPMATAVDGSTDVAPTEWSSKPHAGLTATATPKDGAVQFDLSGTSEGGGWVNIFAGAPRPTEPGSQWTFTVAAKFTAPDGAKAVVRIGARRADGSYIAELDPKGVGISGEGLVELTGIAPPESASIEPYIQFVYPVGAVATGTLTISHSAVVGPTP